MRPVRKAKRKKERKKKEKNTLSHGETEVDRISYAVQVFLKLKLLKPTGHVMYQQFNIQQLYALPTLCLCVYLRTNSDLCHLQHKLIGFYNRDEKCLLCGKDWVFK
jgi:hypothetical protein